MSKKTLILIAITAVLAIGGVTGYFVLNSKTTTGGSERDLSLNKGKEAKKEEVNADTEYEDASGFSFKHPKDVKIKDVTPESEEYFTQLDLVKGSQKITITVKDTSKKSVDDFIKTDSNYAGVTLVGATSLGGVSAKQYAKGEVLITVAIDQSVIYLIEGPKDGGYWEDVQTAVISSFKFSGATTSGGTSSGADIIYEQEEVIE